MAMKRKDHENSLRDMISIIEDTAVNYGAHTVK
jgi:hypothetical protein